MKQQQQRRRTRRAIVASIAAGATVAAVIGAAVPASAAITSTANSNTTVAGLAAQVAAQAFPSGSSTAVVSVTDGATYGQAGSLAVELGLPLLATDSTADATALVQQLNALKAAHVILVSGTTSVDPSFGDQLTAAGITTDQTVAGTSTLAFDAALISAKAPGRVVMVDRRNSADLAIGTNMAMGTGNVLLAIDGTETDADLNAFFDANSALPFTLYGDANIVADHVSAQQGLTMDSVTSDTPVPTQLAAVDQMVGTGRKGNRVFASPSDSQASIVSSGMLAKAKNGVSVLAGPTATVSAAGTPAASDLGYWKSEAESVTLTGLNVTTANATALGNYASGTRVAAPSWRVTDTTVTATNFAVSFTAYSGAVKYVGYDVFGNTVATSTTPKLTVTGNPIEFAIAALNSKGTELKRMEFGINRYLDASDRQTAVLSSTVDGSKIANLQILGTLATPRVITRTMTDPYNESSVPVVQTIATTCLTNFTDTGLDATKQYKYDVTTEGGLDNQACKATAAANPDQSAALQVQDAAVTVPATAAPPTSATVASAKLVDASASSHAARPTSTDAQLMLALGKSSPKSTLMMQKQAGSAAALREKTAAAAAGPNYAIRWFAFIQGDKKALPTTTPDQGHPFLMFGGDNHKPGNPTASHRVAQDIDFYFQSSPQKVTVPTADIGTSHEYYCGSPWGSACVEHATAKASATTSKVTSTSISGAVGTASLRIHSALPFLPSPPEPAIDVDMKFRIQPGNSTMVGWHDAMPTHEVYSGIIPGEWHRDYLQEEKGLICLFPISGRCQLQINRSL